MHCTCTAWCDHFSWWTCAIVVIHTTHFHAQRGCSTTRTCTFHSLSFSYKGSFKLRAVFVVRPSCTWWLWSLLQSSEEQDRIWCEQREQQSWDKSRSLCCLLTEKLGWYATASNKCQTLNCVSYFNLTKYNCKMRILDRLWCMWFVEVWCYRKLQVVDSDVPYSC